MLVTDFCNSRTISLPDEFYDCLPTECPVCGSPMEMSEVLTGLHCSNPRCPSKVAQRLVAMSAQLGIKDLGESRAEKFVMYTGIDNPLLIFHYEPKEDGPMDESISMEVSLKIANAFHEKSKFTLAEYVRVANLPNVQMSAVEIFGRFDDINEAYAAIEAGGVDYIRECLNIKSDGGDISIRALKVYESLMYFKEDLVSCIDGVTIIKVHNDNMRTIKAVCSSSVGCGFSTKADFYAKCNSLYPNVHIEFGSAVTKSTDYLIWSATGEYTNKVRKAMGYQEKGYPIKIVDARRFLKVLEEMSQEG